MPMDSKRIWIFTRRTRLQLSRCHGIQFSRIRILRERGTPRTRSIWCMSWSTTRGRGQTACRQACVINIRRRARHSILPYPYPEGKGYPADEEHLVYELEYNTRTRSDRMPASLRYQYSAPSSAFNSPVSVS